MAQRPNPPVKGSQQQNPASFPSDIGLLMQHLRSKPLKVADGSPASLATEDSQKTFPFQPTPSGNLKIIPNQVVFQSRKVSVLVAEPRHAKVNVKGDQPLNRMTPIDLPQGITAFNVDKLRDQRRHADVIEGRPRTQPHKTFEQSSEDSGTGHEHQHRDHLINDIELATLGFTADQPIDWNSVTLPEKTDLYLELSRRITTYKNADCIVRIGHDEFHCHLLVLQSYSSFFDDKNVKEIDLTKSSVTSTAFSIIYDWMISLTSESCHLLKRDNILEIFLAAQYLGIKELEEQCWAFIDNDELFCEDTAFLLYLQARKIGNTAIMELMVPRIMKFFLMLVSTKDFLELSLDELCLLLRSNYISVNSEMEVLMSAVRWLMHDWGGRKQYLLEVMKCVRFGLIAPWQLVDVKRNPENPEFMELMSYPEIQKMVDDGLAFVIIKYWYGNQTEDYYHWIDLLGLTEPTNRNWAGEDKNYVTYREFLLYLEEYQRTKMTEFRNKKSSEKHLSPSSLPKEESLQSTATIKTRTNHQNPKISENNSSTSDSVPSKLSSDTSTNNVPHAVPTCMMMPPEVLSQYFNNVGRNATKLVSEESENHSTPKMKNKHVATTIGREEISIKLHNVKKLKREKEKVEDNKHNGSRTVQELYTYLSLSKNLTKTCENLEKLNNTSNPVKSEEDAAIIIQSAYKGYKTRRKFREIRIKSLEDKRTALVVDHTIPSGANLNKSVEPNVTLSPSSKEQNEREDKRSDSNPSKTVEDFAVVKDQDTRLSNQVRIVHEKSKFNVNNVIETMSRAYLSTNDEETSTITPRDTLDPDTFSLRNEDRSNKFEASIIQNCVNVDHVKPRYYSASELHLKKKVKKNELKRFSMCKLLSNAAENCYAEDRPTVCTREAVLVFGGIDPHADFGRRGNTGRNVYRYKPEENSWEVVDEMPEPRHHHSVAYLTGRIYLVGGADPREDDIQKRSIALGTVWSYDPRVKNWCSEPTMLTPRRNFGLVVCDGKIFAIGGQNKNGVALRTVEAFDPVAREWKELKSMHIARIGPATTKFQDRIWVAGGMTNCDTEPLTKDVECYEPTKNVWFKTDPMRLPRCFSCLHVVSNHLFIIGGAGKTTDTTNSNIESMGSIDVWNENLCNWQRQTEISNPRHGHTVSSIGNQLIILGGVTTLYMRALNSIECYNPERDKWIKGISPLPSAISGHGSITIPSELLADS